MATAAVVAASQRNDLLIQQVPQEVQLRQERLEKLGMTVLTYTFARVLTYGGDLSIVRVLGKQFKDNFLTIL